MNSLLMVLTVLSVVACKTAATRSGVQENFTVDEDCPAEKEGSLPSVLAVLVWSHGMTADTRRYAGYLAEEARILNANLHRNDVSSNVGEAIGRSVGNALTAPFVEGAAAFAGFSTLTAAGRFEIQKFQWHTPPYTEEYARILKEARDGRIARQRQADLATGDQEKQRLYIEALQYEATKLYGLASRFAPQEPAVDAQKILYVGNLSTRTCENHLHDVFNKKIADKDTVKRVYIHRDNESGRSRGFGFIEMINRDEAKRAIETFGSGETEIKGRTINVNFARHPRSE